MHFLLKKMIANDIVMLKEHINHGSCSNRSMTITNEVDTNGGHVLGVVNASKPWKGAIVGDC